MLRVGGEKTESKIRIEMPMLVMYAVNNQRLCLNQPDKL